MGLNIHCVNVSSVTFTVLFDFFEWYLIFVIIAVEYVLKEAVEKMMLEYDKLIEIEKKRIEKGKQSLNFDF